MDKTYTLYMMGDKSYQLTQREYKEIVGRLVCVYPKKIIITISNKQVVIFTDKMISIEEN